MMYSQKKNPVILRDKKLRLKTKNGFAFVCSHRCVEETNFCKTYKCILLKVRSNVPVSKLRSCPISKIRNFCLLSGKRTSVFSRLRISRLKFRKYALFGLLPGVRKSLW